MPGYETKFVHPLLKRHECPICLYAMKNPVQTECGHLFCRECLKPIAICPLDKEEITQVFLDNFTQREILKLDVYCDHKTAGCPWVGRLKDLEAHLESCEHGEIQCIQCGQYIQAASLKTHQDVDCPEKDGPCAKCSQLAELMNPRTEQSMHWSTLRHFVKNMEPELLEVCQQIKSRLKLGGFKATDIQTHVRTFTIQVPTLAENFTFCEVVESK